jgi:hypothetical protein
MSSLAKAIDNDELQLTADFFSCLRPIGGVRSFPEKNMSFRCLGRAFGGEGLSKSRLRVLGRV